MRESETPHSGPDGTPGETQRLVVPMTQDPPLRTQKLSVSAGAAGRTQTPRPPAKPRRFGGWMLSLVLGGAILLGGAAYLLFTRGPAARPAVATARSPEVVAPGAQTYLNKAKAGDAYAMRMLGVMYYYGLNVPQDREKGIYWYRKAAEHGSDVAKAELEKLGVAAK